MWIEELKRELTGRQLDIWEGRSGLGPEKEEAYRRIWRRQTVGGASNQEGVRRTDPRPVNRPASGGCGCKGRDGQRNTS